MAVGGGGSMLSLDRAVRREQFEDEQHKCLAFSKKGLLVNRLQWV